MMDSVQHDVSVMKMASDHWQDLFLESTSVPLYDLYLSGKLTSYHARLKSLPQKSRPVNVRRVVKKKCQIDVMEKSKLVSDA
jgi:hypothetical protein